MSPRQQPLWRSPAAGRAALSLQRKLCRPSSCLEPGAWAFWLLRGPWPAQSEKRTRFFPLLQPAAIVEKVNTPHSLTGKSSSQEWEAIRSLFQPSVESPQEPLCAARPHWEHRDNASLVGNQHRTRWPQPLRLSRGGPAPCVPSSLEGQKRSCIYTPPPKMYTGCL